MIALLRKYAQELYIELHPEDIECNQFHFDDVIGLSFRPMAWEKDQISELMIQTKSGKMYRALFKGVNRLTFFEEIQPKGGQNNG